MGRIWQVIGPDMLCKCLVAKIEEVSVSGECPVWSWKAKGWGGLNRPKVGCVSRLAENASLTPAVARTREQAIRRAKSGW